MLTVENHDGVQVWEMGVAPVNALGAELLEPMEQALAAAIDDATVSVVVVTSGLKVFSGGADASWMAETVEAHGLDHLLASFNHTMDRFRALCVGLRRSELLSIAAINGHALAGGLELAAACDLRFAAAEERIKLGVSEMKLFGVLPSGAGGAQFIARLLGPAKALDFILRADNVSPHEALDMGLVERLYPAEELLSATIAFGQQLAGQAGRIGINAAKRSVLDASTLPVYDGLDVDRLVHWDAMRRGGFLPGVAAFVEQFASRSSNTAS